MKIKSFVLTLSLLGALILFSAHYLGYQKVHAQTGCIVGEQCDINESDLGISNLSVAVGGVAFGNVIDTRGYSNFYFMHQCSNGPYDVRFRLFDANGTSQTANAMVTNNPAGVTEVTTFGTNHDPTVVSGQSLVAVVNPDFKIHAPFRAIQLGFKNNGSTNAAVCNGTLVMQ